MLNEYKHLDNGLTVIYFPKNVEGLSGFVINTDFFEILDKGTKGYWVAMMKDGKYQVFSYVDGKYIRATRLIAGILNDPSKQVEPANGNFFDLRTENLVVYNKNSRQSDIEAKKKERASKLSSVEDILKNKKACSIKKDPHPLSTTSVKPTILLAFERNGMKKTMHARDSEEAKKLLELYDFFTS